MAKVLSQYKLHNSMNFFNLSIKRKVLNGLALRYNFTDLIKLLRVLCFKRKKKIPLSLKTIEIKILSLDSRIDRRQQLKLSFNEKIDEFIYKAYCPDELVIGLLPNTFINNHSLKHLTESSIACIISHINCWLDLLVDSVDSYLILEDDAIPLRNTSDIFNRNQNLPSYFDIIILGNSLKEAIHVDSHSSNGFFIPWICRRGFYSYIISKKGVKRTLKNILPIDITCGGIDTIVGREIRKQNVSTFRSDQDFFGVNKNSLSDIWNPDQPRKLMNTKYSTTISYEYRVKNNTRFLSKLSSASKHNFDLSGIS